VLEVTALPGGELLDSLIADPDPADPLTQYRRTSRSVPVRRGRDTPTVTGRIAHLTAGALLRAHGKLLPGGKIDAEIIAVLSRFATPARSTRSRRHLGEVGPASTLGGRRHRHGEACALRAAWCRNPVILRNSQWSEPGAQVAALLGNLVAATVT
jgi:hypothetical protein